MANIIDLLTLEIDEGAGFDTNSRQGIPASPRCRLGSYVLFSCLLVVGLGLHVSA